MALPPDHVSRIQDQWRSQRPDVDVAPQGVFGRLHRLADHLRDELAVVFAQHGLSEGEFDVLATLRRSGDPFELTPSELASHTMVTSGATSKRLDRLERAGLLTRRSSGTDKRGRPVRLTSAGLRTIDAAFTDHMANEHRLIATLSAKEIDQLQTLLRTWATRLETD